MAGRLEGKTALVTGADSGIGRAIATTFGREGADVAVHYFQDERGAEQTAGAIRHHGRRAEVFQADLTDTHAAEALYARVEQALGRIDILVNNAGMGAGVEHSLDTPLETFIRVINLDLVSPWVLMQAAGKAMIGRGGGVIVNITSVHEEVPQPGGAAYDAAKGGLRMLTRTLGLELARQGVRVNAIAPGMIATPMTTDRWNDPEQGKQALERIPLGRPGEPQEIANVALLLASDEGSYLVGTTVFVDGGLTQNVGGV